MTIRIGKFLWDKNKNHGVPITEGYTNVYPLTDRSKLGWQLSPYLLKDKEAIFGYKDAIMENLWQGAKIYKQVAKQNQYQYGKLIWSHPAEIHIKDITYKENGKIKKITTTPEYWDWREKIFNTDHFVRYPNGYYGRHECVCALWEENGKIKIYDYIEGRKKIYAKVYAELVKNEPTFKQLKRNFEKGECYQILDVDGPTLTEENKDKFPYNTMELVDGQVPSKEDWGIDGIGSIELNRANITALLYDTDHPLGHCAVLGCCLMGVEEEWLINN